MKGILLGIATAIGLYGCQQVAVSNDEGGMRIRLSDYALLPPSKAEIEFTKYGKCGSGIGSGEKICISGSAAEGCWMDFDCDGSVDAYLPADDGELVCRSPENEVFFKQADRTFMEAKRQLRKYSDLEKKVDGWKKGF